MIFFSPTLVQNTERKEKIVIREYMNLQKTTGFLDNLWKPLVTTDIVGRIVERISNPGFPDYLELPQWLLILIGFHLFQIFFILFTSHLSYLNKQRHHNIFVEGEFDFVLQVSSLKEKSWVDWLSWIINTRKNHIWKPGWDKLSWN